MAGQREPAALASAASAAAAAGVASSSSLRRLALARHWERLSAYDQRALVQLGRWRHPLLTQVMRAFTYAGDAQSWTLIGLLMIASGPRGKRNARLLAVAAIFTTTITQSMKRALKRPRPSDGLAGFIALAENPDAFSFPSGHAAAAFAVAAALGGRGGRRSSLVAMHALGIALSRVYLGAHYPVDVAVGALIGSVCGFTTRWALD